jgi:hypothetical protein
VLNGQEYSDIRHPQLLLIVGNALAELAVNETSDHDRKALYQSEKTQKYFGHPNRVRLQMEKELLMYSHLQRPYNQPLDESASEGHPQLQWWRDIMNQDDTNGRILPVCT